MTDENIFRAYDIRGIYGENLTDEVMKKIGISLREMFPNDNFMVGNDIRKSGKNLAKALIEGLNTKKNKVIYSGTTAFGETLLAGVNSNSDKILFITASHSPPNWNGMKLYFGDGEAFSSELIYKLRDKVLEKAAIDENSSEIPEKTDFSKNYIEFMRKNFDINDSLKIVIDCGNGSTCITYPKVFKELGFDVITINDEVNPEFPARTADIKPDQLSQLKEKVEEEKADLGVAFDGDGDRFILLDKEGNFHRSDRVGLMLAKHMIKKSTKDNIIITQPVSMAAETQLEPMGAKIKRVPVGHTYVINNCKECNALLGTEESGHLIITDYFYFDDSIIGPLKTAEIMSKTGKGLNELIKDIPNYPFEEIVFKYNDDLKFKVINKLAKKLSKEYSKVSTLDGLRIKFDDGWVLFRASNTGPKIRLYVEATSEERFKELKNKFTKIINRELEKW